MLKDIIKKKSIKQKSSSHPESNYQTWTWDQDNPIESNIYIYIYIYIKAQFLINPTLKDNIEKNSIIIIRLK